MSKYYWLFNLDRCIGCETCVIACKQENTLLPGVQYRKLRQFNPEQNPNYPTFRFSSSCHHCEDPSCMSVCPVNAYEKRDDIIFLDSSLCIGCKLCLSVCPYEAPQYIQLKKKVEKCNLCLHRLQQGLKPACEDACPTGALQLIEAISEIDGYRELLIEIPNYDTYQTKAKIRFLSKRRRPKE